MFDVDKIQAEEAKIVIKDESYNDRIARIWCAGLVATIDNEILLDLMRKFNCCQQAHDYEY